MNNRDDEHDDWNGATHALFRAARRVHDPSAADRARVDAALASRLNAAQQTSVGTAGRTLDPRGLLRRGAALKVASVALFIAAGFGLFGSERRAAPRLAEQVPKSGVPAVSPQPPQSPPVALPRPAAPAAPELAHASDVRSQRSARPHVHAPSLATRARDSRGERGADSAPSAAAPAALRAPHAELAEAASAPSTPAASGKPSRSTPTVMSDHTSKRDIAQSAAATEAVSSRELSVTTSRSRRPDDSPAELKLVADMHAALMRADFAGALALCVEHERRWPSGDFALEREGVRAIAGCKSHATEADAQAKRFLVEHPHAPVAMRVRAACAPQPTAARER